VFSGFIHSVTSYSDIKSLFLSHYTGNIAFRHSMNHWSNGKKRGCIAGRCLQYSLYS